MKINYWHLSSRRRFSRIARGRCATGQRWTLDNFSLMCLLLLCVSAKRHNWTLTSSRVGSMSNCKHASLSLLSTSHIEHSSNKPGVQRRRANKIMQTSLLEHTALFSIISQHFRCHFENIFLSLFSSSTLAIHLKLLLFDFRFFYLTFSYSHCRLAFQSFFVWLPRRELVINKRTRIVLWQWQWPFRMNETQSVRAYKTNDKKKTKKKKQLQNHNFQLQMAIEMHRCSQ